MKVKALWVLYGICLVLMGGCTTPMMKATPFYEGTASAYTAPIEDRVNLWPFAYYRAPATSFLWPLLSFSDDHLAIRPLYSQYKQKGAGGDYDEFSFLWPYCQIDTRAKEGWAFPFYWKSDRLAAYPFFSIKEKKGKHELYVYPLLSAGSWSDRTDIYSWYALCGLASIQKDAQGIGTSWCFPFYYQKDNKEFCSLLYSWKDQNGTRTTDWLTPLVGTWSGWKNGFWFWPLCEYSLTGDYDTLQQNFEKAEMSSQLKYQNVVLTNDTGRTENVLRPCPQGQTVAKGSVLGIIKWSTDLYDQIKGKSQEEYIFTEKSQCSCPLAFSSNSKHDLTFDCMTRKKRGERLDASLNLLGPLYDAERHLDTEKKIDRARQRILHWLWCREEENGNVSIDMLPGFTYDSKTNGYFKTSFLWRFFRYEEAPGESPKIDLLYVPLWR